MQFRREAAAAASDGGASASSSSPSSYYIVWSVCRHLPHLFGIFRKLLAGWLEAQPVGVTNRTVYYCIVVLLLRQFDNSITPGGSWKIFFFLSVVHSAKAAATSELALNAKFPLLLLLLEISVVLVFIWSVLAGQRYSHGKW